MAGTMEWRRLGPGAWHGYMRNHGLVAFVTAQTDRDGKRIYRYSETITQSWGIVRSIPRARKIVERNIDRRTWVS